MMNKKLMFAAIVGASMVATAPAMADNGIKYNYLEGRFVVDADYDGFGDGDGFGFGGSYRLDELFYVTGDYETIDYDLPFPFSGDLETTALQIGLGLIIPYEKIDGIAEVALIDYDLDTPVGDDSDMGFRLSGGVRGYLQPNLELRGTLNYIDIDDDDTFITIAADYFINNSLSVNVSKDLGGDYVDRLSIGVRYYLGE